MSHEIHETDANMQEITRLRRELAATRADLDTLRNGVAWLGAELDRARRWGALWKRAAKEYRAAAHFAEGVYRRRESRIQELRAAIEAERRAARWVQRYVQIGESIALRLAALAAEEGA